mmetsp:Transcript_53769/g.149194  ORF Transcript_53769/g.149194 Transcript_53769/m.149194 type:complete len:334 (-) Transcript_53769:112-1113(-)
MPLLIDDLDADQSVSMTWEVDADGALRHKPSGMRVSPDRGVEVDGHEYRLSPQDIELDSDTTLGTGSCGVVQAGIHKPTGMRVAVKTVKVDNKEKRELMLHEIKGLIQAEGCPYLVQWYAGFVAKETGLVHVVVELMDRGSLADLRRRLGGEGVPPQHLACIAAQIVRGLHHLQTRRLLHRDVKPENVLHNLAGQVKLTDFGISKDLNSTVGVAATFVGTANYMSPERALGKDYSYRSDIWSAGMVIYELATGKYPFTTKVFLELYECLCVKPEPRLDGDKFPEALCDFVAQCLTRDESRRPEAASLINHEFVKSLGEGHLLALAEWLALQPT